MSIRMLAAFVATSAMFAPDAAQAVTVGQPAPPFILTTFDKTKVSLDQLREQVVVLNYWATWCVPCRAEMPVMDAYHRRHAKDGLRIRDRHP